MVQRKPSRISAVCERLTYPFQLFPHILGMTRGQHTKHHGHRWVIGEEIESRGVEIWDIEVAEVEHSKEGGCYVCGSSEHWTADCTAKGRPIHRATCGGMGSLKRWTWWSWQGTIFPTIPGATTSVSSQPTGAHAPSMGPGGRRGGLLKGPTEDHHEAEPLMEIVVDNKPLKYYKFYFKCLI